MAEVTFCDFCNPEMVFTKTVALPAPWAEALGVKAGTPMQRGFCYGPMTGDSAWVKVGENHKCSVCVQEERDRKSFKGKKGAAALSVLADAFKTSK